MNAELGLLARDRGIRRGDIGFDLVERYLEIALVNPRQYLAGLDGLIVADQHLAQISGYLGRDGGVIGLHISVIGRDEILADSPVIPAVPRRAGKHRDCRASH